MKSNRVRAQNMSHNRQQLRSFTFRPLSSLQWIRNCYTLQNRNTHKQFGGNFLKVATLSQRQDGRPVVKMEWEIEIGLHDGIYVSSTGAWVYNNIM